MDQWVMGNGSFKMFKSGDSRTALRVSHEFLDSVILENWRRSHAGHWEDQFVQSMIILLQSRHLHVTFSEPPLCLECLHERLYIAESIISGQEFEDHFRIRPRDWCGASVWSSRGLGLPFLVGGTGNRGCDFHAPPGRNATCERCANF